MTTQANQQKEIPIMDENSESKRNEGCSCTEECKRIGACFKCRHHDTIRTACRVTGVKCKYPTKDCEYSDYPWGR